MEICSVSQNDSGFETRLLRLDNKNNKLIVVFNDFLCEWAQGLVK